MLFEILERKKTCQQLARTDTLNETMRTVTMNKIKCSEVDYVNFDPSSQGSSDIHIPWLYQSSVTRRSLNSDKNLNRGMGDGMKLLMEKFRSQVARKQKTAKTTASVSKDEL